jgi:hypothetical protein
MAGRGIAAGDHPDKDVRRVLRRLVATDWTLRKGAHWGTLYCPCGCSTISVPGSSTSPSVAARRIARVAARCPLPEDDPRRIR